MTALIPIEQVNALDLFVEGGLRDLLKRIKEEATDFESDVSTAAGRKLIAAQAYKVARSKVVIEEAGKALVADWKTKATAVDKARKQSRDYLDELRDWIRQPLTEWEAEEAAKEEVKRIRAEIEAAHAEALPLNEIFDREQEIKAKEAAQALAEQKRQQEAREKEIAEAARKEAELEAERRVERMRVEQEQAQARAAREAEDAARKAEQAARDAERKAEADKKAALEAQERRHAQEKADAEAKQRKEDAERHAREADLQHQRDVNRKAFEAFKEHELPEDVARGVVVLIVKGLIPGVRMVY